VDGRWVSEWMVGGLVSGWSLGKCVDGRWVSEWMVGGLVSGWSVG